MRTIGRRLMLATVAMIATVPGRAAAEGAATGLSSAAGAPGQGPGQVAPARTIRVVIDSEPGHLNPLLDPDLWGYRIAHDLICEPLVRRHQHPTSPELPLSADKSLPLPAAAGNSARAPAVGRGATVYEPVLAERYRIDADGRGIELWLRRGVRFHDGRPLTVYDVLRSIEMVRTAGPSAPRTAALLGDVVRVLPMGKEGLRIDLRRPSRRSAILGALAELDILPASQFPTGRLLHQPFNRRPICTGPYRLAEWRRGRELVLRRSPGYWGPPPANDELRFRVASDGALGLSLLRQGEADVLGRVAPRYLAEQVDPAVHRGRFQKLELDANQVVAMVPNARHPLLGMTDFRRAVAMLLDRDGGRERERLLRDARKGLGTPLRLPFLQVEATGAIDPGLAVAPAEKDDLAAVEALLDRAGLSRVTPDGARLHEGRPIRLHLLVPQGSSELAEVARRLGELVAKVGLRIESEPVDLPTLSGRLRRGLFELALCAWSWTGDASDLDVEPLLAYALPAGSPALAELSLSLTALRDGPEPLRAAGRLVGRWNEEAPLFLLYRPRQVVLLGPQLEPGTAPLVGDFLNLRTLSRVQRPVAPFNTALR